MAHRSSVHPVRAAERRKSAFLGKKIPDSEVSKETWAAPSEEPFILRLRLRFVSQPEGVVGLTQTKR